MDKHSSSKAIALKHRRTKFEFADVPVHWNDGDVFTTRFLDALSVNFPVGERFFMDSVRAYEDHVSDDTLREQIRLFVRQEAQHGAAHNRYNERLAQQGVDVASIVQSLTREKDIMQTHFSRKQQIAMTAAAEHVTAMLAEGLLGKRPMLHEKTHPVMRALFLWHAVEEVEHKAVAFDTYYRAAGGDYVTRVLAMLNFTVYLHVRISAIMSHMLDVDQLDDRRSTVLRGLWSLYGPRGHLTKLLPSYLAWFKPNFHPWESKMPRRVAEWSANYERLGDPVRATAATFA